MVLSCRASYDKKTLARQAIPLALGYQTCSTFVMPCCPLTNCACLHLASSEAHILEDVNKCVQALQEKDPENVDRAAGQIRGRTARLEDVVTAEMENYQQGPYTDNVMRAVLVMRNESKMFCSNL